MDDICKASIASQFGAAITMLENAIRASPRTSRRRSSIGRGRRSDLRCSQGIGCLKASQYIQQLIYSSYEDLSRHLQPATPAR
jgi:hypothetical protein